MKKISEIIVPSKSGVQLISGGTASSNLLNVENKKRYAILNQIDSHLKDLNDVKLVVDIAAGAEDNALVFAMACDRIVIVIVGEPTSFVDSYALLKAIFSKSSFKNYCIVVNQVQDDDQGKDLFLKFQKITSKFLDVNLHYVGSIKSSPKIRKSIINRIPLVSEEPKSELSQSFLRVAKNIYETPTNEWGGLTFLSKVKKELNVSMTNYYSEKSKISINELIEKNLDLVKKIAWQIFGRVQKVVEVEDLIQQGMEGLVSAAQKYSPKEGVNFQQYAQLRIRGSIIDFLRKNSNLCRTTIKKKQEFEKCKRDLQKQLGREPSKYELIEKLGIKDEEYNYWEKAFEANTLQSLDQAYDEYSILYASSSNDPEISLQDKQLKDQIKEALSVLNQREAMVAQLYYVEELNIYEISEIMEISTGRISQIKKVIIEKLRNEIG